MLDGVFADMGFVIRRAQLHTCIERGPLIRHDCVTHMLCLRMEQAAPVVRASYAKTVIASMKQQAPGTRDRMLAGVDTKTRQEIRDQGLFDWVAAGLFAALASTVVDTLGPTRAKLFWRTNLLVSLERRLLTPLRLGAVALYGNNPGSLLRMTPQAWQLVTRDCGTCRASTDSDSAILRFDALPSELCSVGLLMLWGGGSEACIELLGFEGSAEAAIDPTRSGAVTVHARWRDR